MQNLIGGSNRGGKCINFLKVANVLGSRFPQSDLTIGARGRPTASAGLALAR